VKGQVSCRTNWRRQDNQNLANDVTVILCIYLFFDLINIHVITWYCEYSCWTTTTALHYRIEIRGAEKSPA